MQVARHAELRVDRGTAQCLGSRVLNVGVSRGADANGDEFLPVCVQDVGQSGREQNVSGALGHSGELGLHGFQDVVRIVVAHDDGVAGQSVRAGVAARDEAGDVDAGDGGKDGVVSGKGDATIGEGGEIRREVGADLRWLEAVECDYENAGHWLDVLSVESLSAEPTLTEKATRKRLQLLTDAPGTWRKIWRQNSTKKLRNSSQNRWKASDSEYIILQPTNFVSEPRLIIRGESSHGRLRELEAPY